MPLPASEAHPRARARSAWRLADAPLLAGCVVTVFFLLLLARDPLLCWKDDLVISVMPVFSDVARAWRHGEWPLLSPFSWACGNLAGEYQYGTFSPVVNLAVVAVDALPVALPAKAAALSLSQLFLLALGACLLGRRRQVGAAGGLLVAIVAALNGWNVAWGATDWFGALAANAWLPWCWWAFEEALEKPAPGVESPLHWWWRRVCAPALFVYLLVAAGFPYTVGMLAVVSGWLALRTWVGGRDQTAGPRLVGLWPLAAGWLLGVGLAAPAWLSLLEYIPGSDRAHGVNVVPTAWSVPWTALPALILPTWRSPWPDFAALPIRRYGIELAGGLVPLALLAANATRAGWHRWTRRCGWELGLTLAVLLLCMLPSPGLFRWSFRWLPLFALILTLTAVRGADLAEEVSGGWFRALKSNAGVWAAASVAVVWMANRLEPDVPAKAAFLPAATLLLVLAWAAGERSLAGAARRWLPPVAALVSLWLVYSTVNSNKTGANTAELGRVSDPSVPVYAIGQNILAPAPLSIDRLYLCLSLEPYLRYRDWQTPANFGALIRPGSTSMYAGLHLVNGYSPIMSAAIGQRLDMETHGNVPEKVGATFLAAGGAGEALLERIGVDGLIISFDYPLRVPPPAQNWELVYTSSEGQVYHRRGGLLPAIRASGDPAAANSGSGVSITRIVDGRQSASAQVDVPADGKPALITFRRPFLPGYHATLNGRALPVRSEGLMPQVELPPGSRGDLELTYRPRAILGGGGITVLSLALLFAPLVLARRRNAAGARF